MKPIAYRYGSAVSAMTTVLGRGGVPLANAMLAAVHAKKIYPYELPDFILRRKS